MTNFSRIPVIIPAYRPNQSLIRFVRNLNDRNVRDIVIVDDGSGETFRNIFAQLYNEYGCTIIEHAVNLGRGRALKSGFNALLSRRDPNMIGCVITDCYGSYSTEDVTRIIDGLEKNSNKLIIGARILDESLMSKSSRVGNKVQRKSYHSLLGINVTDCQSVLRAIPVDYMQKLMNTSGEGYVFDTNMIIDTKKYNVGVMEIPVKTRYSQRRTHQEMRTFKDNFPIYLTFAKYIFTSVAASIVDIILFTILCKILVNIKAINVASMYVAISTALARLVSATINYRLNYKLVFQTNSAQGKTFAKWVILCVIQMAMSATAVSMLHSFIGGEEVLYKIPVDFALFFFSYYFSREFVYK